jgi:BirA family biotin operon repressor/biotin-[acetyl-CoA-carboxylase] ligase
MRVLHFSSLGSTNDYLKQLSDAPEFTVVVADAQTAGRGRRERTWVSLPGEGLYLSVLLCPNAAQGNVAIISLLTAVAAYETLAAYCPAGLDIKWPNDLLIHERKVGGILVEGMSSAGSLRLIVGIGVNLNHESFPTEISATATSLYLQTGQKTDVVEFRDRLLARLTAWYGEWTQGRVAEILARWQALSSYAQGQAVTVTLENETVEGITAGLTQDGALLVRTAGGETRVVLAGEVMRLRTQQQV